MTGVAAIGASAPSRAAARPVVHRPGRVALSAIATGLVGQAVLFDVEIGVNAPLIVALLVSLAWAFRAHRVGPMRRDAWIAPTAVVFAGVAAVRADPTIVAWSLLAAAGLATLAAATFGGSAVMARPFAHVAALFAAVGGWIAIGATFVVAAAGRTAPVDVGAMRSRLAPLLAIGRGLLLLIPVVAVFLVLLTSADAVFAALVDSIVRPDVDLGDLGGRLTLAAAIAWATAGLIGRAASPEVPGATSGSRGSTPLQLGTVEAVTVLVGVAVIFATFVVLQGAYLFGGLDTMQAIGMTYSSYARRGFFELVAVAVLAGGLVIALDRLVLHRSAAFLGAAVAVTGLTGVIVVSAAMRLSLYQEAYGWTELRLYVLATIGFLGVAVIALVAGLVTDRVRWLGHAFVGTGLAILLGLAVVGPVRFITEQNVARVLEPSLVPDHGATGLDTAYVLGLGDDAIPALVRALPALEGPAAEDLRAQLVHRLRVLRGDPSLTAPIAWNLGREAARAALEDAERRGLLDS